MKIWIYLDIEESVVEQLQNEMARLIPSDWNREHNPHVSIIPGIEIPDSTADQTIEELQSIVDSMSVTSVSVSDFHFYPALDSSEQTYVVSLKAGIDLSSVRSELVDCIEAQGGEILYDYKGVTPHITLYKSGDSVDSSKTALNYTESEFKQSVDQMAVNPYQSLRVGSVQIEEF